MERSNSEHMYNDVLFQCIVSLDEHIHKLSFWILSIQYKKKNFSVVFSDDYTPTLLRITNFNQQMQGNRLFTKN